jgi:hypothetical protein
MGSAASAAPARRVADAAAASNVESERVSIMIRSS